MSDNELASSADEGSDAEKAEALNAKVQRVMAPLMKKMGAPSASERARARRSRQRKTASAKPSASCSRADDRQL